MTKVLNDEWIRFGLGFLVAGGVSAITSMAVNTTQIGGIEKRQDADMAQIREIFSERDKVDRITVEAHNERYKHLQDSVDRLERRMDAKFGVIERGDFLYVGLAPPPLDVTPQIFDKELKAMRAKLDVQIDQLKAGKLDTEDKRDEFYSMELDYEILKGWQIWCETSPERRSRCLHHFKKNE